MGRGRQTEGQRDLFTQDTERQVAVLSIFHTVWLSEKEQTEHFGLKTTVNVAHFLKHRGDPLSPCTNPLPQPGPWVQLCAAITMADLAWITWFEQVEMGHKKQTKITWKKTTKQKHGINNKNWTFKNNFQFLSIFYYKMGTVWGSV